jgi:hypothetical protein
MIKISDFYFNSLKKIGDDGEDKMREEKIYLYAFRAALIIC